MGFKRYNIMVSVKKDEIVIELKAPYNLSLTILSCQIPTKYDFFT